MAEFNVTIEVASPIHLSSGAADVNLDADIVRDRVGLPYFPARRFKGLLYESAVEVEEMLTLAGHSFEASPVETIFHHASTSEVQLIVPNFYVKPYDDYQKLRAEWDYLEREYGSLIRPTDVLETFASTRYQTRLENGVAKDGSLHNMRVLDAGVKFYGRLQLLNGGDEHLQWIALALRNLKSAGSKRNRGFGRINCRMDRDDELIGTFLKGALT
ncbi:MAG: hypothetical protein IJU71_00475 [Selenomonadaceae bacterium]|nr:hypothetical protein [Selenomonadaceae bacterium]